MPEYFINRSLIKNEVGNLIKESRDQLRIIFILPILLIYTIIGALFFFVLAQNHHYVSSLGYYYLPLLVLIIGILQYILAQAAHEAIHFHIVDENNFYASLCAFLILYPIGITRNYRKNHLIHHTHFGHHEKDPDYLTFMYPPKSKLQFWLMLLESISGLSTAKRILNLVFTKKPHNLATSREIINLAVVHLLIFSLFFYVGIWWGYFLLWILPLAFVTKTLINIRLLAEHSPFGNSEPALRTFMKNDFSTYLLGIYGFKYHAEHHLFPGIPSHKLKYLSKLIDQKACEGTYTDNHFKIEVSELSYIQYLKKYYSILPTI